MSLKEGRIVGGQYPRQTEYLIKYAAYAGEDAQVAETKEKVNIAAIQLRAELAKLEWECREKHFCLYAIHAMHVRLHEAFPKGDPARNCITAKADKIPLQDLIANCAVLVPELKKSDCMPQKRQQFLEELEYEYKSHLENTLFVLKLRHDLASAAAPERTLSKARAVLATAPDLSDPPPDDDVKFWRPLNSQSDLVFNESWGFCASALPLPEEIDNGNVVGLRPLINQGWHGQQAHYVVLTTAADSTFQDKTHLGDVRRTWPDVFHRDGPADSICYMTKSNLYRYDVKIHKLSDLIEKMGAWDLVSEGHPVRTSPDDWWVAERWIPVQCISQTYTVVEWTAEDTEEEDL
jgi:hypothetical protein